VVTAIVFGAVCGPGGGSGIGYREWVRRKGRLGGFHNYVKLKTASISASVLEDFATCYYAKDRRKPGEAERFRGFGFDEIVARDNLDILWLEYESLEVADNLRPPRRYGSRDHGEPGGGAGAVRGDSRGFEGSDAGMGEQTRPEAV
jgi:hypothetical protein